ncbi:MAG: YitT family protein, partial [Gammaproteobacteria bacterium]
RPEAILIGSGTGVSPWTVLAQGISNFTNWTIGFSTFIVSLGVLIFWFPLKQQPGIGTILNLFIIAGTIDLTLPYLPSPNEYSTQILQAAIGIMAIGLGSGFYLTANLGPGPRDGLMVGLQKKTGLPIITVRTALEFTVVISGWMMGGLVGLGTIMFVFGIGPSVAGGLYLVGILFRK